MTLDLLQILIRDQDAFRRALRKTQKTLPEGDTQDDDIVSLLKGKFQPGRLPYIHQVTLPDSSQIRIKFYDTVKKLFNNKNVELTGKESFLSYVEVSVLPKGQKGYSYTTDVLQVVWGTSKSAAIVKHKLAIDALISQGADLGIDLSSPSAWCTTYSENY